MKANTGLEGGRMNTGHKANEGASSNPIRNEASNGVKGQGGEGGFVTSSVNHPGLQPPLLNKAGSLTTAVIPPKVPSWPTVGALGRGCRGGLSPVFLADAKTSMPELRPFSVDTKLPSLVKEGPGVVCDGSESVSGSSPLMGEGRERVNASSRSTTPSFRHPSLIRRGAGNIFHSDSWILNSVFLIILLCSTLLLPSPAAFAADNGYWTATGSMGTARPYSQSVLLQNGKVLVVGGGNSSGSSLNSAELYDPGAGTYTSTGSMTYARYDFSATLLPNGKVLITGGTTVQAIPPQQNCMTRV